MFVAPTIRTERTPKADARFLNMQGLNPTEAANLIALKHGLTVHNPNGTPVKWTLDQVNRMLFLAAQAESGKLKR